MGISQILQFLLWGVEAIYLYTAQQKSFWAAQNYSVKQISAAANGQARKCGFHSRHATFYKFCHFNLWHNSFFSLTYKLQWNNNIQNLLWEAITEIQCNAHIQQRTGMLKRAKTHWIIIKLKYDKVIKNKGSRREEEKNQLPHPTKKLTTQQIPIFICLKLKKLRKQVVSPRGAAYQVLQL